MRNIHFNGDIAPWCWKVSKRGTVVIFSPGPEKKKYLVAPDMVTGRHFGSYERGIWKESDDCKITPSMVREYIEDHILKIHVLRSAPGDPC